MSAGMRDPVTMIFDAPASAASELDATSSSIPDFAQEARSRTARLRLIEK
jgi:hypothetical protein